MMSPTCRLHELDLEARAKRKDNVNFVRPEMCATVQSGLECDGDEVQQCCTWILPKMQLLIMIMQV
jgi:hypothetical protein